VIIHPIKENRMRSLENVIDGRTVPRADRRSPNTISFRDPRTGSVIGDAPDSSSSEVDDAYVAADRASAAWRSTTPSVRQRCLLGLADLVEAHVEELLDAEVACTGKPRAVTKTLEVLRAADQLRFFAGAARIVGGTAQTEYVDGVTSTVRREPLGVVGQVTPWNYPLMMAVWKIGPALAAGNTVVLKPAETTPWSTILLGQLAQEVLPAGVLNVVCGGRETGRYVVEHPRADLVAITGSVRAGAEVMSSASRQLKNVHLELGGKAPVIVFGDVDLPSVASKIALGAYFNAGQDCTAATRAIVHQSIAEEFTAELAKAAEALKTGPEVAAVDLDFGPLNSASQRDRVEEALEHLPPHAKVVTGGHRLEPGYFFEPTLITAVRQTDDIVQQEIFGPVLTVQSFSTEDEAVSLANGVPYGLASSVWTTDVAIASRMITRLDFGAVWVNCHQVIPAEMPHGGFKESGIGNDLSIFAVEEYTRLKSVAVAHEY
jgi:aldehyde dehydrogenase (NAD+)/betaine-aldehyde dehydrogenase